MKSNNTMANWFSKATFVRFYILYTWKSDSSENIPSENTLNVSILGQLLCSEKGPK